MRSLILLLTCLFLVSCDGGERGPGADAVRITFVADEGLGDAELSGAESYTARAIHLGLTARAADGRIIPSLATSWRVLDNGRSYVFKLREAYWPDRRRITAGDVVAVLRRAVAPGTSSPFKPYLLDIEGAVAVAANRAPPRMLGVDDPLPDVVTITLSQQSPNLLALLAEPGFAVIRDRDTVPPPSGAYALAADGREPGGGGPDGGARLVPNSFWHAASSEEAEGQLTINLEAPLPAEAAIAAFEENRTDIVTGGATDGLRRVRTEALAPALRFEPSWGLYGYAVQAGRGPLMDVRVRRALSMAIDRQALIADAFALTGMQPAFGPLPPTLPAAYAGAVPDWAVWAQADRTGEAARLLQEAGYSPANPLDLAVAIPQGETHRFILSIMAAAWEPLGVRVRAYRRTAEDHRKAVRQGDFDLALIERISPVPVARWFLAPWRCDTRLGGFCDPDADRLLRDANVTEDPGTRVELTRRAARLLADDAAVIPLFSPVRWNLVRPGITGWQDNISGVHPPRYLRRN